ncbi:MAG: T9SS type A sorting domain-containing protein, partial [Bacteroidota bacterium]
SRHRYNSLLGNDARAQKSNARVYASADYWGDENFDQVGDPPRTSQSQTGQVFASTYCLQPPDAQGCPLATVTSSSRMASGSGAASDATPLPYRLDAAHEAAAAGRYGEALDHLKALAEEGDGPTAYAEAVRLWAASEDRAVLAFLEDTFAEEDDFAEEGTQRTERGAAGHALAQVYARSGAHEAALTVGDALVADARGQQDSEAEAQQADAHLVRFYAYLNAGETGAAGSILKALNAAAGADDEGVALARMEWAQRAENAPTGSGRDRRAISTSVASVQVASRVASEQRAAAREAQVGEAKAAHPNPFNPTTTIPVVLEAEAAVRVAVYDVLGRQVALLHDGVLATGRYDLSFDASSLASGVYVVRASIGDGAIVRTQRVTLLK